MASERKWNEIDPLEVINGRLDSAMGRLSSCDLCPRRCGVDRTSGEIGACKIGREAIVASYGPHHGEEKPLVGRNGSGTIFFSGCNLACQYCQNWDISQKVRGEKVNPEGLGEIMLSLQARGCHNINLVSPSHVVAQILEGLNEAFKEGLKIPIVYNTGGYDSLDTLKLLDGIVDIYMPDMKYSDPSVGKRLSLVEDYPSVNREAVKEMYRQVGDLKMDRRGVAMKGLLVRHLVLPGGLAGSAEVARFLTREISSETYVNVMAQYRPEYRADQYEGVERRPTPGEYVRAVRGFVDAGIHRLDERYLL